MAYSNVGFATATVTSGNPLVVAITGKPAQYFSLVNNNLAYEVTLEFLTDRDDDGVPMIVRAESILTMNVGQIYGMTVTLGAVGTTGTIDLYWW